MPMIPPKTASENPTRLIHKVHQRFLQKFLERIPSKIPTAIPQVLPSVISPSAYFPSKRIASEISPGIAARSFPRISPRIRPDI